MSITRRGFLSGLGSGAAGAAGAAVLSPSDVLAEKIETRARKQPQRFSRMFERLPPFADATPAVRAALTDLGAPGGLMDAQDPLHFGPLELLAKPDLSPNNRDNPTHTAGITFLGQFIDHDLTFDTSSPLGVPTAPESAANARTPRLDLDAVYGRGWIEDPHLYDPADRIKLKVGSGGTFEDVPRMGDHTAIIADPRIDEQRTPRLARKSAEQVVGKAQPAVGLGDTGVQPTAAPGFPPRGGIGRAAAQPRDRKVALEYFRHGADHRLIVLIEPEVHALRIMPLSWLACAQADVTVGWAANLVNVTRIRCCASLGDWLDGGT